MGKKKNTFQNKLRKQILLFTTIIIAALLLLFFGSIILYNRALVANESSAVNKYLTNLFTSTYKDYEDFVISLSDNENYRNYILNGQDKSSIFRSYYAFNIDKKIKSNMVLTDRGGKILMETFSIERNNDYFRSFVNMMRDKVLNSQNPDKIETGVYSFIETSSEYVMSGPVTEKGNVVGFAMLFLDGNDWNYEISGQEFNGAITDKFGNIIGTSSKMIIDKMNKFKPEMNNARIRISDNEYIIEHTLLQEQDINIYSLIKVNLDIYQYLFGSFIILILGLVTLGVTEAFSRQIAKNNTKSIDKLINEIYIIKNGDLDYKIRLGTDDEIETIAESVNDLVERIKALIEKNTELVNTRRISEIKQLEAQFSPHFLFNTLETVRYSILLDPKAASELTALMTRVLRYSIGKGPDMVKFSDSLEYTLVFLKIYKYRLGKNFEFIIDASDECNDILIPKLLLQPIIENSVKYGYARKTRLTVGINARVADGYLKIVVEDDGSGIAEEDVARINRYICEEKNDSDHLGLFNAARRISLQYGNESGIRIESRIDEGTKVIISIKVA